MLLLILIYISFISLGLPDSLLGTAWPVMRNELGLNVSYAGILSMVISGGTIISSLFSERFIRKFGTGKVTLISVFMTAMALLGFSLFPNFLWLILCAIPLGLGAGSVDAALNNFVALHYRAKHMSWLHCFWGIGATTGPVIMSYYLNINHSWRSGYRTVGWIQIALVSVLLFSLPLWKKRETLVTEEKAEEKESFTFQHLIKLKGAKPTLFGFFCYCAIEATAGLWGSSFLVIEKGLSPDLAASWISLYYFGITFGRFLSGFLTLKMTNRKMIRLGQGLILLGVLLLIVPGNQVLLCIGFFTIGLGCAPIYPCMLHNTPKNFGEHLSQAIMGIQMACAYVGSTLMPPLFGLLGQNISMGLLPYYLGFFLMVMIFMIEKLNRHTEDY